MSTFKIVIKYKLDHTGDIFSIYELTVPLLSIMDTKFLKDAYSDRIQIIKSKLNSSIISISVNTQLLKIDKTLIENSNTIKEFLKSKIINYYPKELHNFIILECIK